MAASAAVSPLADPQRARPDCDPWNISPWLDLWWQYQAGGRSPARWGGAELALVRECRWGLRRLHGAGGDGQRRDLACPPGETASRAQRFAQRLVQNGEWDWLDVDRMAEPAATSLAAELARAGCHCVFDASERQRYARLDRPWSEVERDMDVDLARRIPRYARKLAALGAQFELAAEPDTAWEECLGVEASGWKGRAGTAMLSSPQLANFYRALVAALAAHGWLRLYLLRLDGAVIAFKCTVLTPRGLAGVKIGMADEHKRLAPGLVIAHWVLQRAHTDGQGEYDFLGGDSPSKAAWTPYVRQLVRLQAFAPSLRGSALVHARGIAHAVRSLRRASPASGALPVAQPGR